MKRKPAKIIPGVDQALLVKDAAKLLPDPARRRFLTGGASLGALTLLTGCDVTDGFSAEDVLKQISKFNDAVQARLFDPNKLAKTYPESFIMKPFPYNAYYPLDEAPDIKAEEYKLELSGLIRDQKPWTLDELYKLPQEKQVTRHICVEGWSAVGSWSGPKLGDFLKAVGADTRAKYVRFVCAEGYSTCLDMPTCFHPQTQMSFRFDNQILPRAYGYPMKIRVPTRLGFKNPKYVVGMEVTNDYMGGYWEDLGYNDYSGL
ncbi:MAG: molybdopterin-dependent oxidoreductase [Pseudomonadota bacterium]